MDEVISDGLEHVRFLADTIGKRPTGFDGEKQAAEYLCAQLSDWRLEQVGIETFPARSWDFDACDVACEALGTIDALPVEFSGSTPAGGLEAELVVSERPAAIDPGTLAGKIVLSYGGIPAAEHLLNGGAAGLILTMPEKSLAWNHIIGPASPLAGRLPMVTVGFADAAALVRHGVTRVRLDVQTTIADVTGHNVVATLRARDASSCRRLNVSGHYDSVPAGGAAADNATGAVCALEVVHTLAAAPLDATVDLVVFSAEEIGLNGAAAYAASHAQQLQQTELGIYFDGQGDFLGLNNIHIMGSDSLFELAQKIAADIGYDAQCHHHFTGLDQVFLSAHGVPTMWFQRSPQLTWHTRADISDDVSPAAMRASIGAAVENLRHVAANPGCFAAGIPAEMAKRIRDYVKDGAPCW